MKKVVIVGGHFTPAEALLDELEGKALEIVFFGRKHSTQGSKNPSAEYVITTKKGIRFIPITAGKFERRFTRYTLIAFVKIPVGFIQSLYYLFTIRPQFVVSFGGYLSLPVVFCAWLLGIPSIIHEQSTIPGLATKINALFSKKIFLSWPNAQSFFDKSKTKVIGNLIRKSMYARTAKTKEIENFLEKSDNLIFITGGNQGSHFINNLIFQTVKDLSGYQIIHQIGTADIDNDHKRAASIKRANYLPRNYIEAKDMGAILNKSKIVISRSGANTVWELGALKKVCILLPLPNSASNEQFENAKELEAGGATVLNQKDATREVFLKVLKNVAANYPKLQKKAENYSKHFPQNASQVLAAEVLKYT